MSSTKQMNRKDFIESFYQDGFAHVRSCITQGEHRELSRQIERYKRETVPKLKPTEVFYEICGQPNELKQLRELINMVNGFQRLHSRQDCRELRDQWLGIGGVLAAVDGSTTGF